MNKYHHRCSCQTTDTNIVPNTFIISYLHPLSKQKKQCFLDTIQGVIIDIIGPTRDLVEIDNDDWTHLDPFAIGDLIKSISGHTVLAYPDLFLDIDDPPSVPMDSPSCTSNSLFDFGNINANAFPADPPDDPLFKDQWYLTHTRVNEVWSDYGLLGSGITIAVLDSGANRDQEDLQTTFLPGRNVINDSNNTSDSYGHGTEVSGIIAATTNNGIGIASVAPHAKVRPIKIFNESPFPFSRILKGLEYVIDQLSQNRNYAQIVNLSVGGEALEFYDIDIASRELTTLIEILNNYNVLVVMAAGNEGNKGNTPTFPAILGRRNLSNVITAGGINEEYKPVPSSSYDAGYVNVAAPGINILTTDRTRYYVFNNRYTTVEGTSFAAPIVSGILALMYQQIKDVPMLPGTKTEYLRNKLFESAFKTAETYPRGVHWRYGVVNAYAAIRAIRANPPQPI